MSNTAQREQRALKLYRDFLCEYAEQHRDERVKQREVEIYYKIRNYDNRVLTTSEYTYGEL